MASSMVYLYHIDSLYEHLAGLSLAWRVWWTAKLLLSHANQIT